MNTTLVIPRVEGFEGRTHHMYVCTGGEVTVGIGHAIQSAGDALKLVWSIGNRPASAAEIQADYATIAAEPKGRMAASYAPLTQCRMADADIDTLIAGDVVNFEKLLAAKLPNWDTYPEPAKEALFDMAFNLGIHGLEKFPHMLAAIDAGLWSVAAAQCHREGIGESRNKATAALFQQAAG